MTQAKRNRSAILTIDISLCLFRNLACLNSVWYDPDLEWCFRSNGPLILRYMALPLAFIRKQDLSVHDSTWIRTEQLCLIAKRRPWVSLTALCHGISVPTQTTMN